MQPPQLLALALIGSWTRGNSTAVLSNGDWPVLRITMDTEGIRAVARLPKRPEFSLSVSQHEVFYVNEISAVPNIQACIRVCSPTPLL